MKSIVFDTGPIISLAVNDLLWILEPLSKRFDGKFYISEAVKRELVDKPMKIKRFKFEALRVMRYIDDGILNVLDVAELRKKVEYLLNLANSCFKVHNEWIRIVHYAEMESLAAAIMLKSAALVIDERTTRVLIEENDRLRNMMESKLHTKISVNYKNIKEFQEKIGQIKLIRSVELVAVSYELGLLDRYLPSIKNAGKELLDSVLWGLKLNGCAISSSEIEKLVKMV